METKIQKEINKWRKKYVSAWNRAEKAESELATLRRRLMEPDEEMLEAGKNCFLSGGYVRELFKAMCAVALKEGK